LTGGRVLHAIEAFGTISESFLADRLVEVDCLGWESWVGTLSVTNRDVFPFPPESRLLRPAAPSLRARALSRLTRQRPRWDEPSWPMGRFIVTARPHLVHAHFGWTAAEVLPAVKRAGLPLVAGFHGYDATVFPHHGFIDLASDSVPPTLARDPYRRLFEEADRVLAVSQFLERRLRELGFAGPIDIVPSGIRLAEFPFRGPRRQDGAVRLLFVGRQVVYKGLDVLIRALAHLEPREPDLRLDVIGDGPTLERSRALAEGIGLARRIVFHGEQSRSGVVRALQAADMLVVPSRTTASGQAEGLSNVIKEALAVGLPVVATRNGGIPEVVPPRYRHELVPENDDGALAEQLAALLRERQDWDERSRIGRDWVERNFDWSGLAKQIAAVYDEVTASRSPGAP
jgi:colanic acid/amylovoran biosynthesis glycosyltransferase